MVLVNLSKLLTEVSLLLIGSNSSIFPNCSTFDQLMKLTVHTAGLVVPCLTHQEPKARPTSLRIVLASPDPKLARLSLLFHSALHILVS